MLALDTRKATRLKVTQLAVTPTPAAKVEPTPAAPPLSAFNFLAAKNPALVQLVAALDLVEVSYTDGRYTRQPEPLSALSVVSYEPVNPILAILARQTFAQATSYAEEDALTRLADRTTVSRERATNGLSLMLCQNILARDLSGAYYLADSTPF